MHDKKLTDNEIIDGFNHCLYNKNNSCEGCCFKDVVCDASLNGKITTLLMVAEVLNRLQAENERVYADNMTYKLRWARATAKLNTAKAEAYKECIEKVKEKAYTYSDITGYRSTVVDVCEIDGIYEELVGDNND